MRVTSRLTIDSLMSNDVLTVITISAAVRDGLAVADTPLLAQLFDIVPTAASKFGQMIATERLVHTRNGLSRHAPFYAHVNGTVGVIQTRDWPGTGTDLFLLSSAVDALRNLTTGRDVVIEAPSDVSVEKLKIYFGSAEIDVPASEVMYV